ncbi:flagellar hook-associated protein 3 FlgL [Rhizobium petrolearium]|uniref:flagellar hook-associated family protein n=1 Tax=Neorhizobium petrolearium TaxID=515361 RepID=UPI001AE6D638|nr:flagellar hook-associated family protein [Neorhizobium petrolearium]MBP1842160.1 flagellar hook-associated protein 3 FlgL [Neorhizobium petrolearium]
MKTSFISTLSVQTTMRNSIAGVQREMVKANQEAVTMKHADLGVTLGASTSRALDLSREISRIESLLNTASLATTRLESAELSLDNMNKLGLDIQSAILTLGSSTDETSLATARQTMSASLAAFTDFANTSVKGEYIFAGINTDVKPMEDYFAPGSPAKAAFDTELNYYMSSQVPPIPSLSAMTEDQMNDFLDDLEAKFNGTAPLTNPPHPAALAGQDLWTTFFSSASDENMKSRISPTEVIDSSTNANSAGMRNFAFASIVSMELLQTSVSQEAREAVSSRTNAVINKAMNGVDSINQQRTTIGISTERVSKVEERLQAQEDILTKSLGYMENVDPEEAATRLNTMKTLLETAYTVTAKIQQLSLANFL